MGEYYRNNGNKKVFINWYEIIILYKLLFFKAIECTPAKFITNSRCNNCKLKKKKKIKRSIIIQTIR